MLYNDHLSRTPNSRYTSRHNSKIQDNEVRRISSTKNDRFKYVKVFTDIDMSINRTTCKISMSSAADLKELLSEDPLMKRSLEMKEMKKSRQHKISVTSIKTDSTEVFVSDVDNGFMEEKVPEEENGVLGVRRQR